MKEFMCNFKAESDPDKKKQAKQKFRNKPHKITFKLMMMMMAWLHE